MWLSSLTGNSRWWVFPSHAILWSLALCPVNLKRHEFVRQYSFGTGRHAVVFQFLTSLVPVLTVTVVTLVFFCPGEYSWGQKFPPDCFWIVNLSAIFIVDFRDDWRDGSGVITSRLYITEAFGRWCSYTSSPALSYCLYLQSGRWLVIQNIQSWAFTVSSLYRSDQIPSATYLIRQNIHSQVYIYIIHIL